VKGKWKLGSLLNNDNIFYDIMKKFYILLIAMFALKCANAQWIPQNSGTIRNLYSVCFTDVDTGYAVGDSGTILKTADGGANWLIKNSGTLFNLRSVFFTSPSTGYSVGDSGTIKRTTNGGTNWENIYSGTSYTLNSVHFPITDIGYIVGGDDNYSQPMILKTIDGGLTWAIIPTDITLPMNLTSVFFITSNTGYAAGHYFTMCSKEIVIKTEDGGAHWTTVYDNSPCDFGTSFKSLFFTNGINGYVAGHWEGSAQIIRTNDGGLSWSNKIFSYNHTLRSIHFPDNNTGYVAGDLGYILKTIDGGDNWINQDSEITDDLNSVFFINAETGYAVGDMGKILGTTNGGGPPVEVNEKSTSLNSLRIYPNPASEKITIETPEISHQSYLSIYNLSGQELLKQTISETKTTIDINNLNPGLYIIKVMDERSVRVGKIIKQ
jgi:photosystem II stability/assembly factor-like uncharacterized protein